MARLDQGLLGGYSGKLGTTVGASWKGINVVRTYQPTVANPNTIGQFKQRTLFKDWAKLASFLLPSHIKPLWDRKATRMSGYNAFMQRNLLISKEYGNIDPMEMVLSQGLMGEQQFTSKELSALGVIQLDWSLSDVPLYAKEDDKMFGLVFNPEGELLGMFNEAIQRDHTSASVTLSAAAGLSEVVVVIAWQSQDGKFQSSTTNIMITA